MTDNKHPSYLDALGLGCGQRTLSVAVDQLGWAVDSERLVWLLTNWCTGNPKCFTCASKRGRR